MQKNDNVSLTDMVKNKGFLSSGPKEVRTQRKQIKLIVNSLLAPCIEPDLATGVSFNAQAIIANPPAYGTIGAPSSFLYVQVVARVWEFKKYELSRKCLTQLHHFSYFFVCCGVMEYIVKLVGQPYLT